MKILFVPNYCDNPYSSLMARALIDNKVEGVALDRYQTGWPSLFKTARKFGFKSLYIPSVKVWHKVCASSGGGGNPLFSYFFTRNRLYFAQKNLPFFKRFSVYIKVIKEVFFQVYLVLKNIRF